MIEVDNIRKSGRPESLEILDAAGKCVTSFHEEEDTFTGVSVEDMERAKFIVKSSNEHDGLKAKAGILKEIQKHYKPIAEHITHYIGMFRESYPKAKSLRTMNAKTKKMEELLLKAKSLK